MFSCIPLNMSLFVDASTKMIWHKAFRSAWCRYDMPEPGHKPGPRKPGAGRTHAVTVSSACGRMVFRVAGSRQQIPGTGYRVLGGGIGCLFAANIPLLGTSYPVCGRSCLAHLQISPLRPSAFGLPVLRREVRRFPILTPDLRRRRGTSFP